MAGISQFVRDVDEALIRLNTPWVEPWRLAVSDGDRMRFAIVFILSFLVATVLEFIKTGQVSVEGFVVFGLLALTISYSIRAISRS